MGYDGNGTQQCSDLQVQVASEKIYLDFNSPEVLVHCHAKNNSVLTQQAHESMNTLLSCCFSDYGYNWDRLIYTGIY